MLAVDLSGTVVISLIFGGLFLQLFLNFSIVIKGFFVFLF